MIGGALLLALVSCGQTTIQQTPSVPSGAINAQGLSQKHGVLGKYFRTEPDGTEVFDHIQVDNDFSIPSNIKPKGTAQHVKWNALLTSPKADSYTLQFSTTGSAEIFFEGTTYHVDANQSLAILTTLNGPDQAKEITIDYRQYSNPPSRINIEWESASQSRQNIPKKYLTPVDLTADCKDQPNQGCLAQFKLPFGYGMMFRDGTQSTIDYRIDNISEVYPLHIKLSSEVFTTIGGEFTIAPNSSASIPLTFSCPDNLGSGEINVVRLEDGSMRSSPLQINCFGEVWGPH